MNLNRYFSLSRASTLQLLGPVVLGATAGPACASVLRSARDGRSGELASDAKGASAASARSRFNQ
jgi:hypothetical protein